eukprot:342523-Rhodomonas_salina.1
MLTRGCCASRMLGLFLVFFLYIWLHVTSNEGKRKIEKRKREKNKRQFEFQDTQVVPSPFRSLAASSSTPLSPHHSDDTMQLNPAFSHSEPMQIRTKISEALRASGKDPSQPYADMSYQEREEMLHMIAQLGTEEEKASPVICLCTRYAMPGTDIAYDTTP